MKLLRALPAAALLASLAAGGQAGAHPITVDGSAAEWLTRVPNSDNLGIVARDAAKVGEYVWRDVANDARTDLASPETIAEITGVQITGTPSGFGVLVRRAGAVGAGKPIQVQLAVDVDRLPGNGQDFLAGFADTKVSNAARWEFLVQTLFGSGGQAKVLDGAFNTVASAQAAEGAGGVEIFVPWSAIGLAGPPTVPLRFTLATFRAEPNDNTTDIGGPSVSNVIDAVTDYGDPRTTAYPNTFAEVQDQIIDYYFDVHFNAQGEVYAPLVVQRFVSAPVSPNTEWIAVRNVSPNPILLDVFKLGDEETPDGAGEGMFRFPAGATLAPGAAYTVAVSASAFQTTFGALPDAETGSTVVAVPKMTAFTLWAPSSIALANTGDEVLVLDGSNTILDLIPYGSVTYAGIPSKTPAPGSNVALTRDAASTDTDDGPADFTATPQCANDAACGGPCKQCLGNVCVNRASGSSCADATVCNGAETCDGAGTCVAGTQLDCDDGKVCTDDACDPTLGCTHVPRAMGTSCDDGNVCNGMEACDGAGACVTVVAGQCDDNNPCTTDTCDPVGGCMHANVAMGTSCDPDGNPCNGVATCNAVGVCVTGPAPSCDDNNPCTADACSPGVGCVSAPVAANTPCGDGNACNGDELCNGAGMCMPGTALDCNDGDPCTVDGCNPATGCTHPPAAAGTSCKDADACNGDEVCNGSGSCVAGAPPVCPSQNPCATGSCDPAIGCTTTPVAAGTSCSADPNCTGQTCDGSGTCGGGTCGSGGSGGTGTGGAGTGGSGTGGTGTGGMGPGGSSAGGAGGTGTATGSTSSSSSSTSSTSTGSSSSSGGLDDGGGCGCRVAGDEGNGRAGAGWLAFGLLAALRARRKR